MKICVVGLGYMGLPTAALLARAKHDVVGADIDPKRVEEVNAGRSPFDEQGMAELIGGAVASGKLRAVTKPEPADVIMVAVPTPHEHEKADLRYVVSATESLRGVLRGGELVILESTVPPNTCRDVMLPLLGDVKVDLVHCPERAIPGNTLHELVNNDRIVGAFTAAAGERARELYSSFVKGQIHLTDVATAETCKLLENSYRDVNIAFANTVLQLSKEIGIDAWRAIELANKHPRVNILNPGPGVGGHCIPIDPWFLVQCSKDARLLRAAREVNDAMPAFWVNEVEEQLRARKIEKAKVAVLGVAYKPDVDDARETPAEHVIALLQQRGHAVRVSDPHVQRFSHVLEPQDEVVRWADVVMVVTRHKAYGALVAPHVLYCSR